MSVWVGSRCGGGGVGWCGSSLCLRGAGLIRYRRWSGWPCIGGGEGGGHTSAHSTDSTNTSCHVQYM